MRVGPRLGFVSRSGRIIAIVGALVVLVVAFVVLKPGDEEPASTTATPTPTPTPTPQETQTTRTAPEAKPAPEFATIVVRGAKPVGGVQEIDVKKGERVRLRVTSPDTTDHIHIHGYDLMKDLKPGRQARFAFTADADGIYEIELEDAGVPIAELTVKP